MPPDYRGVALAGPLGRLHAILFDVRPDRACRNLRVRQYLLPLHSSRYEEYLYQFDARVSYWPDRGSNLVDSYLAGPTVTQTAGPAGILTVGGWASFLASGRLLFTWTVQVLSSTQVQVGWTDDTGNPHSDVLTYPTSGGQGSFTLPGSILTARFDPLTGATWTVTVLARPVDDLVAIARRALASISDQTELALFGVAPVEPYFSFRNLLHNSPDLLERLAGVLLALTWRLEEARTG